MTDRPALQTMVMEANPVPDPVAASERLDAYQSLLAVIDEKSGAIVHDTQEADPPANVPPPPRRSRAAVWVFAAALIVTLVVVGGVALLLRSDVSPVTDEPAPETTVPVAPTEASLVESLVWSRVPYDETVFGQEAADSPGGSAAREMAGVTTGGPGFVAVGTMDGAAAVWTSVDGFVWARVPHDEAVFGSTFVPFDGMPGTHVLDVAAGGPGLIAVGGKAEPGPLLPPGPEAWVSSDGITWSRVPALSVEGGGGGPNCCVAVGDGGLLVIGDEQAWTSADGVTWTPNPSNNLEDTPVIDGAPTEVIAGGPGFIAVGTHDFVAAVWTSTDGITWSRVPDDEGVFARPAQEGRRLSEYSNIGGVTIGGPGFVAVGTWANFEAEPGELVAAVWTSTDGITWSRVPHDEATFGDSTLKSVAAVGDGLVAVGSTFVDFENCQYDCEAGAVWTSTDGITWSRVPHDEAVFAEYTINSVTAGGRGVVAVGAGDGSPAVWVAVPAD